jgi:hypothetical protein
MCGLFFGGNDAIYSGWLVSIRSLSILKGKGIYEEENNK